MMQPTLSNFAEEYVELANFAKAISHPVRIQILKILYDKNCCICGELVDMLPLSQSTVSQHLKELKRVGLIKGTIDGPKSCYCIDNIVFNNIINKFSNFFNTLC